MGTIFIIVGVLFVVRSRRVWLDLKRGKIRGVAGPILIVLGILLVAGILPGFE